MNELMSRDDVIKAFEEEKQKAKDIRDDFAKFPNSVFEQSIYNEAVKAWRTAINIVKELPTIDAVPVVRCKDCKHHINHDKRCKVWNHGVPEYGYCYEGMRKDDDNH